MNLYTYYKDQMKTGDLLEWKSNTPLGFTIRAFTGQNVNHDSLVLRLTEYEGLERRRWTMEALENGTVLNLLSRRLEQFDGEVWWYPLKDEWNPKRGEIGERACKMVGIPYDYPSLFKNAFTRTMADAERLFCSEYCFLSWGLEGEAPVPGKILELGIFKEGVQIL